MGERAESAISVVETPTDATETVALPEKSLSRNNAVGLAPPFVD
jgi:hypothetical protein